MKKLFQFQWQGFVLADRVSVMYFAPWQLDWIWEPASSAGHSGLRNYLFCAAHDTGSWFWRIGGIEINVPREYDAG